MRKNLCIASIMVFFLLVTPSAVQAQKKKPEKRPSKTPKSLFLIKRASITSAVGEPSIYPYERQLVDILQEKRLVESVIRHKEQP
jgi:hypothetical protein